MIAFLESSRKFTGTALSTLAALAVPSVAAACPVCFGQNDSPLALAMNNGILLMLGVVAGVLACFAAFFVNLVRRASLAEESSPARAAQGPRRDTAGQEGIVQC